MKRITKILLLLITAANLAAVTVCFVSCKTEAASERETHRHTYDQSSWQTDVAGHWNAATCGHNVKGNYSYHSFSSEDDATCDICGYQRALSGNSATETPAPSSSEEQQTPASSETSETPQEPEEPEDKGFAVSSRHDGLVAEGISAIYPLSLQNAKLDFSQIQLKVYLSIGGEKDIEAPAANYSCALFYGGEKIEDTADIRLHGEYTAKITLTNAEYEDGGQVEDGAFSTEVTFRVENPVVSLHFASGETNQISSKTDRMSGGWQFYGTRANGDRAEILREEITVPQLDTRTAGARSVIVQFGEVKTEVEYTIYPAPEVISSVSVSLKEDVVTHISGDYLPVSTTDFTAQVSATAPCTVKIILLSYGGASGQSLQLGYQSEPCVVTVTVQAEYEYEGEKVTKTFEREVEVTITKDEEQPDPPSVEPDPVDPDPIDPVEPDPPAGDGRLTADCSAITGNEAVGEKITLASNDNGEIFITKDDTANITNDGGAIVIQFVTDDFEPFLGLNIIVNKPATVTFMVSLDDGIFGYFSTAGGEILEYIEVTSEYTIPITQSGEYNFAFMGDSGSAIKMHSLEVIFD